MYDANSDRKIVDEYLLRCKTAYDNGCYHQLRRDQEILIEETLKVLGRDDRGCKMKKEDLDKLSLRLSTCRQTTLAFFEEISKTERNFDWPKHHEGELRKRINTALQSI